MAQQGIVMNKIYGDVPSQGQHTLYQQSNKEYNANVYVLPFPQCTSENDKTQTNWMVEAILASVFCCFPFGIGAIIFARIANKASIEGDNERAKQNAATARNLIISAVIYGIICFLLILAYITITIKSA